MVLPSVTSDCSINFKFHNKSRHYLIMAKMIYTAFTPLLEENGFGGALYWERGMGKVR